MGRPEEHVPQKKFEKILFLTAEIELRKSSPFVTILGHHELSCGVQIIGVKASDKDRTEKILSSSTLDLSKSTTTTTPRSRKCSQ